MAKKINLKVEKAKRNLAYALQFKKRKARVRPERSAFDGPSTPTSAPGHAVTCTSCGVDTTVPFKPSQGRPVLCRPCFQKAA
ncbi:MAG: CxxC-x17-CxxC domain-containing protein [Candidatus Sericytochromatia bacterium]